MKVVYLAIIFTFSTMSCLVADNNDICKAIFIGGDFKDGTAMGSSSEECNYENTPAIASYDGIDYEEGQCRYLCKKRGIFPGIKGLEDNLECPPKNGAGDFDYSLVTSNPCISSRFVEKTKSLNYYLPSELRRGFKNKNKAAAANKANDFCSAEAVKKRMQELCKEELPDFKVNIADATQTSTCCQFKRTPKPSDEPTPDPEKTGTTTGTDMSYESPSMPTTGTTTGIGTTSQPQTSTQTSTTTDEEVSSDGVQQGYSGNSGTTGTGW